jgi:murein DD-endopeptidase MepM/ murein hydrolase activator NlpD
VIPASSGTGTLTPAVRDIIPKTRPAPPDEHPGIINGISGSEYLCSIERRRKKSHVRATASAPAYRRGEAPATRANARSYRARPGDTLFGVARRFGLTVNALCAANGISRGASLAAGQRLRIPSGRNDAGAPAQRAGAPEPSARESLAGAPRFIWPVSRVSEIRRDGESGVRSIGIIIESSPGTPVISSARGVVEKIGTMRGFGQYVIIKHGGHFLTVYSKMNSINVSEGDIVGRGRVIGSQGGELHFQINRSGRALNPLEILPDRS